jgi:transcriptional regulator with XRE-family HTH domain
VPISKNREARAFGEVLREVREASGQSQDDLAVKAKLNRTFISFMERGLKQPSLCTLLALARGLRLRASTLVAKVERRLD